MDIHRLVTIRMRTFSLLCVFIALGIHIAEGTFLVCHDCTGEQCDGLLAQHLDGRCKADVPGKCFYRRDPNGEIYRGCADEHKWPKLDYNYNGCRYQFYGYWSNEPVLWCFCDSYICNSNITYLMQKVGGVYVQNLVQSRAHGQSVWVSNAQSNEKSRWGSRVHSSSAGQAGGGNALSRGASRGASTGGQAGVYRLASGASSNRLTGTYGQASGATSGQSARGQSYDWQAGVQSPSQGQRGGARGQNAGATSGDQNRSGGGSGSVGSRGQYEQGSRYPVPSGGITGGPSAHMFPPGGASRGLPLGLRPRGPQGNQLRQVRHQATSFGRPVGVRGNANGLGNSVGQRESKNLPPTRVVVLHVPEFYQSSSSQDWTRLGLRNRGGSNSPAINTGVTNGAGNKNNKKTQGTKTAGGTNPITAGTNTGRGIGRKSSSGDGNVGPGNSILKDILSSTTTTTTTTKATTTTRKKSGSGRKHGTRFQMGFGGPGLISWDVIRQWLRRPSKGTDKVKAGGGQKGGFMFATTTRKPYYKFTDSFITPRLTYGTTSGGFGGGGVNGRELMEGTTTPSNQGTDEPSTKQPNGGPGTNSGSDGGGSTNGDGGHGSGNGSGTDPGSSGTDTGGTGNGGTGPGTGTSGTGTGTGTGTDGKDGKDGKDGAPGERGGDGTGATIYIIPAGFHLSGQSTDLRENIFGPTYIFPGGTNGNRGFQVLRNGGGQGATILVPYLAGQGGNLLVGTGATGGNGGGTNGISSDIDDNTVGNTGREALCLTAGCAQICHLNNGSPVCRCRIGYTLGADTRSCNDVNECSSGAASCSQECVNTGGSYYCRCERGFLLEADQTTCQDIDECSRRRGGCSHECVNSPGSYRCTCPTGFTLEQDAHTCTDNNECLQATGHRCDQLCLNLAGTYRCACRQGFTLDPDGATCNDIDECSDGDHNCDQVCNNVNGSFECTCNHGYRLAADKRTCIDVNECVEDEGGCAQRCVNLAGGYRCECRAGYALDTDLHSCDDIDECSLEDHGCGQLCENTEGSYTCLCQVGYRLDDDTRSCVDINECLDDLAGCEHICFNVAASYTCLCRSGFRINSDLHSCDAINPCLRDNGGCSQECTPTATGRRCLCNLGYVLDTDTACIDINECNMGNGGCAQTCVNTDGSFKCQCGAGYHLDFDGRACTNRNECDDDNGGCAHECLDTNGAFRCRCRRGYSLQRNGKDCADIDECSVNNGGCDHICTNTNGSYICSCRGDLSKLQSDGTTCSPSCPDSFVQNKVLGSCYKVFSDRANATTVRNASRVCQSEHTDSKLISIDSDVEQQFLADLLGSQPEMLEGWQGWWTSGVYRDKFGQFMWGNGKGIDLDGPYWRLRRPPYEETCVWILQIKVYGYMWGNYDCATTSGFVCEIDLPKE